MNLACEITPKPYEQKTKNYLSQMNHLIHYPHKTIEIQNLFGKNTPNILYSFGSV